MSRTMSDLIVEILKTAGVKRIYGIPGDTIDTLMESIRTDDEMEFILTRHEANAGFMASGEARMTGKLAVAVACQGPGANNLLNGLADAAGDHVPVLAITGQIDTDFIETEMPQGSNQLQIFEDTCIFNAEARSPENLVKILYMAINAALEGGVAHISVPSDIMRHSTVSYKKVPFSYRAKSTLFPDRHSFDDAVEAINNAKKAVILYGEGARGCADLVVALAEKLQAPLIHTTRSKDIIDNTHPLVFGGIGLMGSHPANEAVHVCDLLIVIGSNFAYQQFYPHVPVVKIDRDPVHLATHVAVDYPVLGDTKITLKKMVERILPQTEAPLIDRFRTSLEKHLNHFIFNHYKTEEEERIHPAALVAEVTKRMKHDAILCGDTGSATIWINNTAQLNGSQRFIWSANLASLGAALGQAVGAWFATGREIVVIVGDGGFPYSMTDLVTAALYEVPIKCFVLNNGSFRFIEFEERSHDGNVPFGTKLLNPDFAAVAEASYCKGLKAKNYTELKQAVSDAFAHDGPVVVDCFCNPDVLLIPPAVNTKIAYNYLKSQIKSWFTTDNEVEERIKKMTQSE